jgi:hypothetical protein
MTRVYDPSDEILGHSFLVSVLVFYIDVGWIGLELWMAMVPSKQHETVTFYLLLNPYRTNRIHLNVHCWCRSFLLLYAIRLSDNNLVPLSNPGKPSYDLEVADA